MANPYREFRKSFRARTCNASIHREPRVRCADADRTWLYISPQNGLIASRHTTRGRLNRWLYNGSMIKTRTLEVWVLLTILTAAACAAPEPDEESLRGSFAQEIASVSFVRDFRRAGDELTFSGPKGAKADAQWRVRIDVATVEPQPSQRNPFKGAVESSWSVDGQVLLSSGSFSGLPEEFLKKGLGQECWAFWDADTKQWAWE